MKKVQFIPIFSIICLIWLLGVATSLKSIKITYLEIPEEVKNDLWEASQVSTGVQENTDETWHPRIRLTSFKSQDGKDKSQFLDKGSGASPFPSFIQLQATSKSSKSLDLKSFYEQYTEELSDPFEEFQDLGCSCKFTKATLQDSLTEDFTEINYTQMPSLDIQSTPFSMIQKNDLPSASISQYGTAGAGLPGFNAGGFPSQAPENFNAVGFTNQMPVQPVSSFGMNQPQNNQMLDDFRQFQQFQQMKQASAAPSQMNQNFGGINPGYGPGYGQNSGFLQRNPVSGSSNMNFGQGMNNQASGLQNSFNGQQQQTGKSAQMNSGLDNLNQKLKMMASSH